MQIGVNYWTRQHVINRLLWLIYVKKTYNIWQQNSWPYPMGCMIVPGACSKSLWQPPTAWIPHWPCVVIIYVFLIGILWKKHVKSKSLHTQTTSHYQWLTKAFKGVLHNPMSNVSDRFSSTLSLLMVSLFGLVCVVLKCLKELQQHGLLVATHFISTYVQYRHTMKKACEKISTYLHTAYIPQSLVIKHAC